MSKQVIFDVETKQIFSDVGSKDPGKLGVSVVSAYIREVDQNQQELTGQMQSFWEKDFNKLWQCFKEADRIIGFNSLHFDVPALQPYTSIDLKSLAHFDILDQIYKTFGKRVGLSTLARDSLGHTKTDQGLNAVLYWAKGDPQSLQKLQKYCEADVAITRDVYDYIVRHGEIQFRNKWNQIQKVNLDFSLKEDSNSKQIGLF